MSQNESRQFMVVSKNKILGWGSLGGPHLNLVHAPNTLRMPYFYIFEKMFCETMQHLQHLSSNVLA